MSREIKFRAWDKQQKCFVDFDNPKNGIQYRCGEFRVSSGWGSYKEPVYNENTTDRYIIEQYPCLKDKNGKEIYEGDIVEIGKYGKFQIIWNEWACKFDFDKIGKREREEPLLSQDWEQKTEVIGNIHENPELLEDK